MPGHTDRPSNREPGQSVDGAERLVSFVVDKPRSWSSAWFGPESLLAVSRQCSVGGNSVGTRGDLDFLGWEVLISHYISVHIYRDN